jgi:hypothetical protein
MTVSTVFNNPNIGALVQATDAHSARIDNGNGEYVEVMYDPIRNAWIIYSTFAMRSQYEMHPDTKHPRIVVRR